MIKKIIGIFIMMLLIGTTVLPIVCSRYNELKFEFSETNLDLPDYFSWRDYEGQDWTTSPKEQGFPKWCGSCWAFSAISVLESVINIREGIADLDPDLSEQYIISCLSSAGDCDGGSDYYAFQFMFQNDSKGNYCNGIIPEVCFPYEADDTIPCESKCEDWKDYLIPIVDYGYIEAPSIDEVKSKIMEYGPVSCLMEYTVNFEKWLFTNHNPENYFAYEENQGVGHLINIIGWKDDSTIEHGGYWICKNSFGIDNGYNGYFNIEYDSPRIGSRMVWVDYDPESYDWHPVPKANGPYFGLVNELIQFQGDASGEHPPFTYHWDFGDESYSEEQNPTHTYTSEGKFTVILTVSDDEGNSFYDETYAWIQNGNEPPDTPILDGRKVAIAKSGAYYTYSFIINDPDTPIVYYYSEVFGDDMGVWSDPLLSSGEKISTGWWMPEKSGSYSIRLKAKDPYGAESDWATMNIIVVKNKSHNDLNPLILRLIQHFPFFEKILNQIL